MEKRLISLVVLVSLILGFSSLPAIAKNKNITLSATASSVYRNYPSYGADRAIDGNDHTYWVGEKDASPWWIAFDAGKASYVDKIRLKWFTTYYLPKDYDIEISRDGQTWEAIYTGLMAVYDPSGVERDIKRDTRYIRLYIHDVKHFPVLIECEAFKILTVPHLIRFQGMLKDAGGVPLDSASSLKTYALTFKIYDRATEGEALWEETQDVDIYDGLLDVELGSINPIDNLAFDKQYWLGVTVEGDSQMSPRFKLTSVPYAFRAEE